MPTTVTIIDINLETPPEEIIRSHVNTLTSKNESTIAEIVNQRRELDEAKLLKQAVTTKAKEAKSEVLENAFKLLLDSEYVTLDQIADCTAPIYARNTVIMQLRRHIGAQHPTYQFEGSTNGGVKVYKVIEITPAS